MGEAAAPADANKVDLSIIVPVYNNERYVQAALDSILEQQLDSFEVIVVDDGSTDGSRAIIDAFASEHPFVRVVGQENKGVAAARNAALDLATGTYVAFLDGDDVLRSGALSDMLLVAEKRDADLVVGEAKSVTTFRTTALPQSQKLSKKALIKRDDPDLIYNFSNCNKIFRRSVIEDNGIRYQAIKHAEDGLFLYEYLNHCGLITGCPRYAYEYRKRLSIEAQSALKTLDLSMFESGMQACRSIQDLTKDWSSAFKEELTMRILRITLLGEYYRRMWVLDDASLDGVLSEMNKLKAQVGEERWAHIYGLNEDLECEEHIKSKDEMLESPLLSVIVLGGMSQEQYASYLSTLYFQTCPNFEVLIDASYKEFTPDSYAEKENLSFFDEGLQPQEIIDRTRGRYIQIVDKPSIYNEDTMRLMIRRMNNTDAKFISVKPICYCGELQTVPYRPINGAFWNIRLDLAALDEKKKAELEDLDCWLANKLFTKEALVTAFAKLDECEGSLIRAAYKNCSYERFNNVLIGFCDNVEELVEKHRVEEEKSKAKSKAKGGAAKSAAQQEIADYKKKKYQFYSRFFPVKKKRVFFLSDIRGEIGGNYAPLKKLVEDAGYELICDFSPKKGMGLTKQEAAELMRNLATSAYILLEDFHADTADIEVRPGQELCQLWHACGAFKKFAWSRVGGNENINIHPGYKKYTKAIVSSEDIRKDYADAYRIDVSKVAASGIPRTDVFFDEEYKAQVRERYLAQYPVLQGKKIVLIAPTYRGTTLNKAGYDTSRIDPQSLHEELGDDYIFVFKWHPAMQERLAAEKSQVYDYESMSGYTLDLSAERDINDLLILADVLVTDYSSVIFEYALLDRPIVYYWHDVNEYIIGRGMFYDMDEYVYGEVAYTEEMLPEAIAKGVVDEERRSRFMEKFMSACDGRSSEKTFRFIFSGDKMA